MLADVRHRVSLARRGWGPEDRWDLDVVLCDRLGHQLLDLAEHGHGHPAGMSADEWQAALRRNGDALVIYARTARLVDGPPVDATGPQLRAAQEALRWVADHLPLLWD
jgi:hypothetical protein